MPVCPKDQIAQGTLEFAIHHLLEREIDLSIFDEKFNNIVEPVFGNIRSLKRLDRFTLRGKQTVNAQWNLYCLVHDIEKVLRYSSMFARKPLDPDRFAISKN